MEIIMISTISFVLFLTIIMSIFNEKVYSLTGWKKIVLKIIYLVPCIIGIGLYLYLNTESIYDFVKILIICILTIYILRILNILQNKNKVSMYVGIILSVIVCFIMIHFINYYSIDALSYNLLLLYIISMARYIYNHFKNKKMKSIRVLFNYSLLLFVIIYGLFFIFDDHWGGTSKSMRKVEEYLVNKVNIDKKNIVEVVQLSNGNSLKESLLVKFAYRNDMYFFYYLDGNVSWDDETNREIIENNDIH